MVPTATVGPPLAPPDLQAKAAVMEAEAEVVTVGDGNTGGPSSGGDEDNGGNSNGGGKKEQLTIN
jgi:hypothetical protein